MIRTDAASPKIAASPASRWREERNEKSRARLERSLPTVFPVLALRHALAQPLTPPTPRLAIESFWRANLLRADALSRALARRTGAPEGWSWTLAEKPGDGRAMSFRMPPAPYRETAHKRGPGYCCVCGAPVYRYGWHADLWGAGAPNRNAGWHAACVAAWKLWTAPSAQVRVLRRRQNFRCAQSGKRLWKTAEVDHRTPLFEVWRDRRATPWVDLLGFWGLPNLQVINRTNHSAKTIGEAAARALFRAALRADEPV